VDARQAAEKDRQFPAPLFVYQGTVQEGQDFFGWISPEARAISDPSRRLYQGFGLERGGALQMFGPEVWSCGMRASRKGHGVGRPVGDPWQMPGFFLVRGDQVLWEHRSRHAGDHPDWSRLSALAAPARN
jgi:hypothetical protein